MTYPTPLVDDSAHPWIIVRLGLKGEREEGERERGKERGREGEREREGGREGTGWSTEKCNNHPSKPFYMPGLHLCCMMMHCRNCISKDILYMQPYMGMHKINTLWSLSTCTHWSVHCLNRLSLTQRGYLFYYPTSRISSKEESFRGVILNH